MATRDIDLPANELGDLITNKDVEYTPVRSLHGRLYYFNKPPFENTGHFCARGERINDTGLIRLPLPAEQVVDLCYPAVARDCPTPVPTAKGIRGLVSFPSPRDHGSSDHTADSWDADCAVCDSVKEMANSTRNEASEAGTRQRRLYINDDARVASGVSVTSPTAQTPSVWAPQEKPIASGNGLAISLALTEPYLFLQGFEQQDLSTAKTTILRGSLVVRVSKPVKLKSISLKFRGRATTDWPEGKLSVKDAQCIVDRHRYSTTQDRVQGCRRPHQPHLDVFQLPIPDWRQSLRRQLPASQRATNYHDRALYRQRDVSAVATGLCFPDQRRTQAIPPARAITQCWQS